MSLSRAENEHIVNLKQAETYVAVAKSLDLGLIFAFKQFFMGMGYIITYPIAAATDLIQAILMMRSAYLEKNKQERKGALLRASVEMVAALAITTAVVGSLAAAATFALAAPIIFTAALAAKSLFHLGSAFYYTFIKKDSEKAQSNLVSALICGLLTIAAGLVFIAEQTSFGILGIFAAALGAVYTLYKRPSREAKGAVAPLATTPASSTAVTSRSLSPKKGIIVLKEAARIPHTDPRYILAEAQVRRAQKEAEEKEAAVQAEKAEEIALQKIDGFLAGIRDKILEGMHKLEKLIGPTHAITYAVLHYGNANRKPLSTGNWTKLMTEKNNDSRDEVKTLMSEIDKNIKAYNEFVHNQQSLLEKACLKKNLDDAALKCYMDEQIEKENARIFQLTGMDKEVLTNLFNQNKL